MELRTSYQPAPAPADTRVILQKIFQPACRSTGSTARYIFLSSPPTLTHLHVTMVAKKVSALPCLPRPPPPRVRAGPTRASSKTRAKRAFRFVRPGLCRVPRFGDLPEDCASPPPHSHRAQGARPTRTPAGVLCKK